MKNFGWILYYSSWMILYLCILSKQFMEDYVEKGIVQEISLFIENVFNIFIWYSPKLVICFTL